MRIRPHFPCRCHCARHRDAQRHQQGGGGVGEFEDKDYGGQGHFEGNAEKSRRADDGGTFRRHGGEEGVPRGCGGKGDGAAEHHGRGNQPAVCACGECEQDDEPFDGGHFQAVPPVGHAAERKLVARLAIAQYFGKPNGNDADKGEQGNRQRNDFRVIALEEGKFFGTALKPYRRCAQNGADGGGKPQQRDVHIEMGGMVLLHVAQADAGDGGGGDGSQQCGGHCLLRPNAQHRFEDEMPNIASRMKSVEASGTL